MALYEYQCEKCGESFEVIQKFSDEPLTTHEKCGGKVQRLISTSAFQFKGSGWYVNDYAKGSRSSRNGEAKSGESSDSKSSESKTPSSSESSTARATSSETKASSSDTKASSSDKK